MAPRKRRPLHLSSDSTASERSGDRALRDHRVRPGLSDSRCRCSSAMKRKPMSRDAPARFRSDRERARESCPPRASFDATSAAAFSMSASFGSTCAPFDKRDRKIRRTDEDAVDPVDRQDLVERSRAPRASRSWRSPASRGSRLQDRPAGSAFPCSASTPRRPPGALAQRRELHRAPRSLGVGERIHHRRDHAARRRNRAPGSPSRSARPGCARPPACRQA